MSRASLPLTVLVVSLLAVAACGDDDIDLTDTTPGTPDASTPEPSAADADAGPPDAAPPGRCTALTLGDTALDFASIARTGLQAPVSPGVPGLPRTRLTLELYEDDGSGELPPLATGTFALGTPPDDNYGTCQHCVLLVASDLAGTPKRAFYASVGTMTVDQLGDDSTIVVGRAVGLELHEVSQNPDLTWVDVADGACFTVADWAFDTRPVFDGPCESVEQCPNEAAQICNPSTGTCTRPQCNLTGDPPFCADGETCLSQLVDFGQAPQGPASGACYGVCDPAAANACGEGETCRVLGPTQTLGICLRTGSGVAGSACTPRDISTGCVDGFVCEGDPGECAHTCTFLTPTSGCNAERYCGLSNTCERAEAGDPAAIGAACASSSPELIECGIEGDAFRGLCVGFFPEAGVANCERLCRTAGPACPGGQVCLGLFENQDVGLCHAPTVCGDGVTDTIGGEVCDDGNTVSGDGCSADCREAQLGALCNDAPALPIGTSVNGTTVGGARGFTSACDPYNATPVALYSFDPPQSGRLHVALQTSADLGISVYSACADDATELGCRSLPGNDVLDLDVGAEPVLVIVRGAWPEAAGSFTLISSFLPAICGDGVAVGDERCDDGNTEDGDGCSADCSTVDYALICAALPTLTLGTTTGTTVGGTTVFDGTGICTFVSGGGTQRAYQFVAPSAGTLSMTLAQPTARLTLAAYADCSSPTNESFRACANGALAGTDLETSVVLAAGERITVVVQGFTVGDAGPYTLQASFGP